MYVKSLRIPLPQVSSLIYLLASLQGVLAGSAPLFSQGLRPRRRSPATYGSWLRTLKLPVRLYSYLNLYKDHWRDQLGPLFSQGLMPRRRSTVNMVVCGRRPGGGYVKLRPECKITSISLPGLNECAGIKHFSVIKGGFGN